MPREAAAKKMWFDSLKYVYHLPYFATNGASMTLQKILCPPPAVALMVCTLLFSCAKHVPTPAADIDSRALRIHDRVLTLDTHVDIPFEFASDSVDPGIRGNYRVDI